jgi:hypothetical protein
MVRSGEQLTITSTGDVAPSRAGAIGILIPTTTTNASVLNQGTVSGGDGKEHGFAGGNGGIGVAMTGNTLTDMGTITGGVGGIGYHAGAGGDGVNCSAGVVTNTGTISGGTGGHGGLGGGGYGYGGNGGVGVSLNGGTLTNSGTIAGGYGGAVDYLYGRSFGGVGGNGVNLDGGTLTNSGSIVGGYGGNGYHGGNGGTGVFIGAGTLITSGTISGGYGGSGNSFGYSGYAVQFGSVAATLVVDPGAVFNGSVAANSSVNDLLELGGTATGTLSGLGTQFTGFTTIAEDAGANWMLSGANTVSAATTLSDAGNLTVTGTLTDIGAVTVAAGGVLQDAGTLSFLGTVTNNGIIGASSGLISFALAVAGTGTLQLGAAGTLSLMAGSGITQTVDFLASTGVLDLTNAITFVGMLEGFGSGDQIDLLNTVKTETNFANGVLTLRDGNQVVASLHFDGSYERSDFMLASDHHGGTVITFV